MILDFAIHAFSFALRTASALSSIMPQYSLVRCATGVGTVLLLCVSWCELGEGGSGQKVGGGFSHLFIFVADPALQGPTCDGPAFEVPTFALKVQAFEGPRL